MWMIDGENEQKKILEKYDMVFYQILVIHKTII